LTYWTDDRAFDFGHSTFETAFTLGAPAFVGDVPLQVASPNRWRPTSITAWVVSASAVVTAATVLFNMSDQFVRGAEPLVDPLVDRRDVRANDRFELPFTIGNLSGTSARVDVDPPVIANDPAHPFQVRWRRGYLDRGEYRDNSVSGRIPAGGEYVIHL